MLGLWMWPNALIERGADHVFDDCALIGATDVFFLTKGLSGRCAFLTDSAPGMTEGRDLLTEAITAAHARGIRLHTWFTSAQDESYCAAHPDSGLVHLTKGPSDRIISIADVPYARYMRALIEDMLSRYPVDGMHLDYVRYNHLLYGWSDADMARYRERGIDAERARELVERTFSAEKRDGEDIFEAYSRGDENASALANARIEDVNRFVDALIGGVKQAWPNLCLSAALMPEGAYDTAFAHLHYGQCYANLGRRFDMIVPMAYSIAYNKDDAWVKTVMQGTMKHAAKALAGLHAYDGGTGLTLFKDMRAAQSVQGVSGICLFRYGTSLLAAADGKTLTLTNPTNLSVTRIELSNDVQKKSIEILIAPGQNAQIPLPFSAAILRAWSEDKEICAYMTKKH